MGDELDRLSEVFAEYMTPDEDGNPLLDVADLGNALNQAGIPRQLSETLGPQMDPRHTGQITFEDFVNVCMDAVHPEPNDAQLEPASAQKAAFVFSLLANQKKQRITMNSLARARAKLHFPTASTDLAKMLSVASTREEFIAVWRQLDL